MVQRQRRVQKKMILAFGLSGIVLIGLLSVVTSRIMAGFLVNQSVEYATQSLNVATQGTQTLLDDLVSEYAFLFTEQPLIQEFTLNNPNSVFNLTTFLSQTALADPLVDAIIFYDVKEGSVAYSNSVSGLLSDVSENELTDSLNQTLMAFQSRPTRLFHHQMINDSYILALTLVTYDASGMLSEMMVVHLNEDMLSSLFTGAQSEFEIVIINEDNIVIADSAQQWLGQVFPSSLNYDHPLQISTNSQFVLHQFAGNQSLLAYAKLEDYNLVFFHVTPYHVIESTIVNVNRVIIGLFMVFVFINLLVSYVLSQRFYAPIQSMVHQFVKQDYEDAKDEFELIASALVDLNQSQQASTLKALFSSSNIDSSLDFSFISFPIRVVVVLMGEVKVAQEGWVIMHEDVHASLMNEHDLNRLDEYESKSIGISDQCLSIEGIRAAYRTALAAAQYADTLTDQPIVYYLDIRQSDFLTSKTVLMNQVMDYLSQHAFSASFSFDACADACGFSLGYIRQVFKETQGTAINDFLITMRINKAKEYLESTMLSGKEISEAVGYHEPRYFYTQFKQRVGMTIESYRSSVKENQDEN